jgi:hypothetical protein
MVSSNIGSSYVKEPDPSARSRGMYSSYHWSELGIGPYLTICGLIDFSWKLDLSLKESNSFHTEPKHSYR